MRRSRLRDRIPLFLVGGAGLVGSLLACGEGGDEGLTDDALYGGGDGYVSTERAAVCLPSPRPAPPWAPPRRLHQGVCTSHQAGLAARCLLHVADPSELSACLDFEREPAFAACRECVWSPSALVSGALVRDDFGWGKEANVAGCVAQLTHDLSPTGCGAGLVAASRCVERCDYCGSSSAVDACRAMARASDGPCGAAVARAACAEAAMAPGAPAEVCRVEGAPVDRAKAMIQLFCGP